MTQLYSTTQTSYDELPYESLPFAVSHPAHLATTLQLFGIAAPKLERCRVLELGCAAGGNLIPLAEVLPQAEFVGVDLSPVQIANGLSIIDDLQLSNIRLLAMSVADIDDSLGQFDFIIAHGLFSWVSDDLRQTILQLCRNGLTQNGVAFISYNTFPGWHMNTMLREMMQFHAQRFIEPTDRIKQARALLEFLVGALPEAHPYGVLLRNRLQDLRKAKDHYFFHEYLETNNQPLYFHQFMNGALAQGLQYLGDADFSTMFSGQFPPQVAETINRIAQDQISQEQYMDFLRNRTFRQTLLVRQEQTVVRELNPEHIRGLYVASDLKPLTKKPDILSNKTEVFAGVDKAQQVKINQPLYKAAMLELAQAWPRSILFEELCSLARQRLTGGAKISPEIARQDQMLLGVELQRAYAMGSLQLSILASQFTTEVSDKPMASPLARWQAEKNASVTNRRHQSVALDDFGNKLLALLDGTRSVDQVVSELRAPGKSDGPVIQQAGKLVTDPAQIRAHMGDGVRKTLKVLSQAALLIE
jgi:methyltransferase-like protein/SAM-dependent methyltransferase